MSSKGDDYILFIFRAVVAALCLALLNPTFSGADVELPFWRKKEKVYKEISENRAIVVSVVAEEIKKPKSLLKIRGAGHIKLDRPQVVTLAQDFSHLPKMSSYVRKVEYNSQTKILFLHTEAFNYHARMFVKVDFVETKPDTTDLQFKIIGGVFTGMQGVVRYQQVGQRTTEISIAADYTYEKLPVPQFFVEFALEVVIQKMAGRMRSYGEEFYRKQEKK